jgi:multidrug efflux pump subunit AcrA (membrane-fusion protein)
VAAVAAIVLCYVIYTGIESRVRAQADLQRTTLDSAVPSVAVIHPKLEARAEEVALPGNVQAFVATPIFARVDGYLKKWYFDIGAHVKAGQLLVEIETPELDQQLDQARADLATAQANYDLSKTTADRYQALLKSDSVARQDVEDRVGDLHAPRRDAALSENLRPV